MPLKEVFENLEHEILSETKALSKGNITYGGKLIGVSRSCYYMKLRKFGLL